MPTATVLRRSPKSAIARLEASSGCARDQAEIPAERPTDKAKNTLSKIDAVKQQPDKRRERRCRQPGRPARMPPLADDQEDDRTDEDKRKSCQQHREGRCILHPDLCRNEGRRPEADKTSAETTETACVNGPRSSPATAPNETGRAQWIGSKEDPSNRLAR